MQVKVFESTDMASGLKMVRKELGPDALILSTRTIKSGKLGLLGKQVLEITAAIDSPLPIEKKLGKKRTVPSQRVHSVYQQNSSLDHQSVVDPSDQPGSINLPTIENREEKINNFEKPSTYEKNEIRQEFDDLKNLVKNLAGEVSRLSPGNAGPQEKPLHSSVNRLEQKLHLSRKNDHVENILTNHGVSNDTARTISSFAQDRLSDEELHENDTLFAFLHNTIADLISVKPQLFEDDNEQKKIALLGPTGVGKTTTLAKIAASYLSQISNSIAFITIDTYRIAAVEQLKVYGEIMHLPVDVVISPKQLEESLNRHRNKKLILIDTAGRSPRDTLCIDELKSFLHPDLEIEKHLVMSATTRENELLQTINQFSSLGIDSTIFTKIDECTSLGVLLNILIQSSSPLSHITNGQRVPEDIVEAEKKHIAQLIIPPPNGILND